MEAYRFQLETHRQQVRQGVERASLETRVVALSKAFHEVRTPLSAILSINETLVNESAGPLTDVQRELLEDTDESAQYLMTLINDILDCTKAEARMITLAPEAVALPELVDQCVDMVEPKAQKAFASVTARIDPNVREIVADPLRLKQILINFLSNAVKYNDTNGVVNVRV